MTQRARGFAGLAAGALLIFGLAAFYYAGATEHGRRVNTARARADQSGYLWDAVAVYKNWHGAQPPALIGERNRMPVYPGLLALFHDPAMSPDAFFERGKQVNIILSLLLLAVLGALFRWYLPPLAAATLLLVIAFGYFIFKAGYVQSELLFYTFLFGAFLCFCHLLEGGRRPVLVAALAGILAALGHLTKASMLPLVALFVVVYVGTAIRGVLRQRSGPEPRPARMADGIALRAAALAAFIVIFLATLFPYISNSKRVFGHYFYNVNTTFYVWYDDWPSATLGTYQHGDGVGWPDMPARELPGMRRYLREHSASQIADRMLDGFRDMVVVTYQRFWIMKFLALYAGFAIALAVARRKAFVRMATAHAPLFLFLVLYALLYLLAIAFYKPISGTTGRMLLAHVAPLLFAITWFITRPAFRDSPITPLAITTRHFHLFVFAMMLFDIGFMLWPRLFADFTGY